MGCQSEASSVFGGQLGSIVVGAITLPAISLSTDN